MAEYIDYVSPMDIANRLNYPLARVRKWAARGVLPVPDLMISGRPVWRWESIEQWHDRIWLPKQRTRLRNLST